MFDISAEAKRVFDEEIEALQAVKDNLNGDFSHLVEIILSCSGRIILTGMGKSGLIGKKISATMSSLGTPSYFLHPAEASHGDLGFLTEKDVLIAISNSGETSELLAIIPSIKRIGAKFISLTCRNNSTLERHSDLHIHLNVTKEACPLNLAPTSSTTATLVFGDALAIVLSKIRDFKPEHYAIFHPGGALGKRLLTTVMDLMHSGNENPIANRNASLRQIIFIMSEKGLGAVSIVDDLGKLVGILTDGDLRRTIEKHDNFFDTIADDVMTNMPIQIDQDSLAVEALKLMENREKPIMVLPIVDKEQKPIGMLRLHDIIRAGVVF
ncbi:KpsF/GutQ family sugar-phosphate isomerase [Candidatus Contubernalis alkaliaceticus]|uniref:KpsF/GutQ family sugar-phosphate isomerase n=1 Tax=Candidatus Contubernalis alkaliaceticus TaxID=338645 RepID=UPI001F4BF958|nr:KpsF/GutQ family sugar-phosphate isomerase [Candidatus Contubernalis alkalaceticus]UNC93551.1 KpsF/GutQ family sugar-phosphate isomerase [Candidatus Contubernalis alkalaceticus]